MRRDDKVLIITVNYKNTNNTEQFFRGAALLQFNSAIKFVVIDNESSKQTRTHLRAIAAAHPDMEISMLSSSSNLYYMGAAALAAKTLFYSIEELPRWIVLCNNDIIFTQYEFVGRLLSLDYKKYGVIAPSIISAVTKRDQNPSREIPYRQLDVLYWKLFYTNFSVGKWLYRFRQVSKRLLGRENRPGSEKRERRIYAPQGAFLIFSRLFFERGGCFDSDIGLFNEELVVAEKARELALPVTYCPSLQVLHNEHSSTGAQFTKAKYLLSRKSYLHVRDRYFHRFLIR